MSERARQRALVARRVGRWREAGYDIAPRIHALSVHRIVGQGALRGGVLPANRLRDGNGIVRPARCLRQCSGRPRHNGRQIRCLQAEPPGHSVHSASSPLVVSGSSSMGLGPARRMAVHPASRSLTSSLRELMRAKLETRIDAATAAFERETRAGHCGAGNQSSSALPTI